MVKEFEDVVHGDIAYMYLYDLHCVRDDFSTVVTKHITNHARRLIRSLTASLEAGTDVISAIDSGMFQKKTISEGLGSSTNL